MADELAPGSHCRDSTYGKLATEHDTIGADEPVIVFLANDKLVPALVEAHGDERRHGLRHDETSGPATHAHLRRVPQSPSGWP